MDHDKQQLDQGAVDGHQEWPASPSALQPDIDSESTAVIITGLDGVIQRVTQTGNLFPDNADRILTGERIVHPFAPSEHTFLQSLLEKARATRYVVSATFPVRLRGADGATIHLSLSEISGARPDQRLLTWTLSTGAQMPAQSRGETEATLNRRIETLDARRKAAERTQRALAAARDTNRSLARSLNASRELSDHQAAMFKESSKTKDELIQRVRDAWATAVDERQNVETASRQLKFLNEANYTLSQSLDFNTTLSSITAIAVPELSDCCVVHLLDNDRDILRRSVMACGDLQLVDRMNAHPEEDAGEEDEMHPLYSVLRTGGSVVIHDLLSATETNRSLAHYHNLGFTSCIVTVLRSRERVLGTMTFASIDPAHTYLPEDLLMAEAIAFSAGQALDNAYLYRTAEEAYTARERYLSMASHELRSPLTVVSGFGSLILRQIASEDPDIERIRMLGQELQRGVERLELLTDGLLASASLQGSLAEGSFSHLDLSALVQDLLNSMNSTPDLIGDHTVTFDAPEAVVGYWDAESLERALFNIISNALKYSPDGRNVHVSVSSGEDTATISVRDQGIGMSEEEQAELFSPFVRGRAARETAQGTGLGLYITKQIVEQHHGEIEVESEPGAGSTFTIRLPLNPSG